MRLFRKTTLRQLFPFLGLTMLSLVVVPSILTPGKLLCTAIDGPHFLARLHEISWLADRGILWPRWAPNMSYGYGYPVFHYYGSLSFYPSLLLHRLGLSLVTSLQSGFWLAFVLSGWTAYLWLQSVTQDEQTALVGATAYLYVPYHINTAIYRLNLPEPWALVFAPLALYGLHRMSRRIDWCSVGMTALFVSALPLTSNLATIVFAPVLVTYALLLLLLSAQRSKLLQRQLASAGLALGLSAFFVIPALIDRQAVQIERGYTPGGLNVFNNFLRLDRIFRQPIIADISRANPLYDPISLSPLVLCVSLIVLAVFWHTRCVSKNSRLHTVWAIAMGIGCVFLSTRASAPVYKTLPFLQVLQFPWRFAGPAALLAASVAALAGKAYSKALPRRYAAKVSLLVTAVLVLLGWPLLYPGLFCGRSPTPTLAEAVASQVGMVGSLSTTAEYVPAAVQVIPTTSPMFEDYLNDRPVIRWDQTRLPPDARTLAIQDDGLRAEWEIETPVAFQAIYQAFVFPGWQATLDDQQVGIQIAQPYGLIQVSVPAGHHTVAVHFGSTPDRVAATILSIAALLTTIALLAMPQRKSPTRVPPEGAADVPHTQSSTAPSLHALRGAACGPQRGAALSVRGSAQGLPLEQTHIKPCPSNLPSASIWLVVGIMGVALLAARIGFVDRLGWLPQVRRFDGQVLQGIAHTAATTYSGGQRLLGYELLTHPTFRGDALELDLYWATTTGGNFRALVRLTDDLGTAWTEWDRVTDFPGLIGPPAPWLWGPDRYTSMRYHIDIPPGTPPGSYNLSVATIDPETRSPHYVTQGAPLNAERTEAIVGQVSVRRKQVKAAQLAELAQPDQFTTIDLADLTLTLIRCDVTQDSARVGETIALYPLWHATAPPAIETLTLWLRDETAQGGAGRAALAETFPFSSRYPTRQWQAGELVRDQFHVLIPASLPPGQYTWMADVAGHEIALNELTVSVPERRSHLPADIAPAGQTLDNFAQLAGYRIEPFVPGQPLHVTLYWQARAETAVSYKAFVHLMDAQNTIVGQSDTIPAAWTRLTTSWLPPEVIEDVHTLFPPPNLAPDTYRMVVGLYEPTTGRRAITSEGQDGIVIAELTTSQQQR